MSEPTKRLMIGQRISAMTADLQPIEATGKNRFRGTAMSVEDVEDALRPLFAKHGVVALWTMEGFEKWEEKTSEGFMTIWRIDFTVVIQCDDEPGDAIVAKWFDIGTSPAATESFAVKGYYRRLFHIAAAEDEQQQPGPRRARDEDAAPAPVRQEPRPAPADPLEGLPPGITVEQWDEVKKLARDVKAKVASAVWLDSGLSSPAKVKARVAQLAASVEGEHPGDGDGSLGPSDEDRALYAFETIKGELESLVPSEPPAKRPGAFSYAATGLPNPTRLTDDPEPATPAQDVSAAPEDAEALRQAALAVG